MVAGGLLASLSLVVAGFVQISVNKTLPNLPDFDEAYVSMWNQLNNCTVTVTFDGHTPFTVAPNTSIVDNRESRTTSIHLRAPTSSTKTWTVPAKFAYSSCSADVTKDLPELFNIQLKTTEVYYVAISPNGVYQGTANPSKPTQGTGEFSLGY
ncbi:hypothetical protein KIN20_009585 [Parelaphostrongylus tenuis]|uniref:Uncharacterized protein n=1 Tax=Parelaphostrongylus tenuis TaxID=148309 RepID=A0AAD5M6K1_PARTN|nr:hypothetical protein KIN20_009585 [Parelaphostrongylus tenuis]